MEQIARHIARSHCSQDAGDITILQVTKYSAGTLVLFTVGTEHRVAYIMYGTVNNVPYTVWDNIAGK